MMELKFLLLFLFVGSLEAATFRQLSKRVLMGGILGYPWMNETHVYQWTGEMFNKLTCENEMKWEVSEPIRGRPNYHPADVIVQYGMKHRMHIRGHTLLWHLQQPAWLYKLNREELHATMINRITTMMSRYKGRIYAWDVVNEPCDPDGNGLRKNPWFLNFGENYIAEAFHLARRIDPKAKLYVNDFNVEGNNTKAVVFFNLVKRMKARGVPIDGVGFQGHFKAGHVPPDFERMLRWFGTLGVDVAVTELDVGVVNTSPVQLRQQASDYARVYKSCKDVSRCVSVTTWGFTDRFSWLKETKPCMWDENFHPKPAVDAVKRVL